METKSNFSYKRFVKRIYLYVTRMIEKGKPLYAIKKGLRRIVNSYQGLNRNERYALFSAATDLSRQARHGYEQMASRKAYDTLLHTARNVKSELILKKHKERLFDILQDETNDTVFFVCSWHSNPAEGHKDYQGKIYVDRYWRQKVSGSMYYAVSSYIRNHGTMTVQDAMKEPVWLLTRPYCKHYFIPVDTAVVLTNSAKKVSREYAYRPETPYTVKDYYEFRNDVFNTVVNELFELDKANYTENSEPFRKKIRRSV